MALMLALGSGLTFGIADFAGGLAAKRAPATSVTLVSQAIGLTVLLPLLGVLPGAPSTAALVSGGLAGIAGALGVAAYLRALALGPMGLVAPLASVVGVMVPVIVGLTAGERPSAIAATGIALGLVAVTVVAGGDRRPDAERSGGAGPLLALAGGGLFGVFFVLLDLTPAGSGLWPLVGARIASLTLMGLLVAVAGRRLPPRAALPAVALSGALDMAANILFLLATRAGLLTITALLASLYPVVVVVLARQVLAERLRRVQVIAVALALVSVAAITVG
ncbi:MAG TPA: EamA family transporter [Euzebyales bacterium]|nr:EamA family transporter [Euzebyales bacterium]